MRPSNIQLRAVPQGMLEIYIPDMSLTITDLRIPPHLPRANELSMPYKRWTCDRLPSSEPPIKETTEGLSDDLTQEVEESPSYTTSNEKILRINRSLDNTISPHFFILNAWHEILLKYIYIYMKPIRFFKGVFLNRFWKKIGMTLGNKFLANIVLYNSEII